MRHLTPFQFLSLSLAVVCAGFQGCILYSLFRRKLTASFRVFTSYTVFGVLLVALGISTYVIAGEGRTYFVVYWILSFLYMSLEFGVMYEILANALKPYSALIDLGKMLFAWAAVFLIIAATITGFATAGTHMSQIESSIGVVEHSMRLMQCGLLLLFFLFERRLGLSWRTPSIFIGLGLGATAAVDLSVSYLKGPLAAFDCQLTTVNTVCYIGVLSFWAFCVALPRPTTKNVLDSPARLIFQRWDEALASYGYGAGASSPSTVESFLPGIEKTVDRVMARRVS